MYNSNYGGAYGSSYGSYGSYGSPYGASSMYNMQRNVQNPQQTNNQPNPQQEQRKRVFEEYFKMMGGLRSMLEIGFAGVAFVNFGSKSWELLKKIFMFLLRMSKRFLGFVLKFIPVKQMKEVLVISTGSKDTLRWENIIISLVRIVVVALLAISYKMRNTIKDEIMKKHDQLSKKAEEIQKKKETIAKNMQKYKEGSNL